MKRKCLVLCLVLLGVCQFAIASEPNPKSYVATASGNNVMLAANPGRGYTLHAIALQSTDEATEKVKVYIKSTSENLIGSPTATTPIDKTGNTGYGGFIWDWNPKGWAAAPIGEPVIVVLSSAQPVIVNVTYSLR